MRLFFALDLPAYFRHFEWAVLEAGLRRAFDTCQESLIWTGPSRPRMESVTGDDFGKRKSPTGD